MRFFSFLLFGIFVTASSMAQELSATAARPVTIPIHLTEVQRSELRARLATSGAKARIVLSDVSPPVDSPPAALRVFLNKPDATSDSPDDEHLLATITFQSTADRGPQGFLINLVPALRHLLSQNQLDLRGPLDLTFVVDPKSNPVGLGKAEVQLP